MPFKLKKFRSDILEIEQGIHGTHRGAHGNLHRIYASKNNCGRKSRLQPKENILLLLTAQYEVEPAKMCI